MLYNLRQLWIFVILWQPILSFYEPCTTSEIDLLDDEECSDLYFEASEKATDLGRVKLELEQTSLVITPAASTWTNTFVKITVQTENATKQFCSKLTTERDWNFYCFTFGPQVENETFLVEYRIEKLPEISSRRFLFSFPNWREVPLFLYIDETDKSRLVLRTQKLPSFSNLTYYKVEAYKEKHGNTNLQDFRIFSNTDDINYELFTYNDMGSYYFVVWVMGNDCADNVCMKISTPKIFIGRKSTRVVIGIVGASFILPFILFIFHILTKRFPPEDPKSKSQDSLVVAYKSSSKKHNELVLALAAFLEKTSANESVEVIDLSKPSKKFPEKFCIDSLIVASRIVYVAPPKNDLNPVYMDKTLSEKKFLAVIFDHCVDALPSFFTGDRTFKLFEDFEKFLQVLDISEAYDADLYQDLIKKADEANVETDHLLNDDTLPKIVVTEIEPQEHDALISAKVAL